MNYFKDRILLPLLIPAGAALFIGILAVNISKIFLGASKTGAVVAGTFLMLLVLVAARWLTTRQFVTESISRGVWAFVCIVILFGGMIGFASQKRNGGHGGGEAIVPWAVVDLVSEATTRFDTNTLEAASGGGPLEVRLTNEGNTTHNVQIKGFEPDMHVEVSSDGQVATGFIELEPGEYEFYCSIPGHAATMNGTLTVTEGTAPAEGAEGAATEGA
jgi:plastocyanin